MSDHPEAALIRRAREARRLTVHVVATRAQISHQRWTQIERSEGNPAPAATIAHMAHTVGIPPDRLAEVRPDAAEVLREIAAQDNTGSTGWSITECEECFVLVRAERKAAHQHWHDEQARWHEQRAGDQP